MKGLLRGGSGMRSELMINSIPLMGSRWGGSRFSRQQSGLARGFFVKAGYSVARTSSEASTIDGANGASSRRHVSENKVLDAYEDEYGGMVIDPERLPRSPLVFESMIQASLSRWKLEGKTGIWLKLPSDYSELVPIAIKEGFKYHHAEQNYVMLTYWIPEGPCLLPANASHQVGVGGFVINEQNEVLVVQEKHCASALEGVWKLPTGFVLESEEIPSGAVREVKEETGINTEFMEIIAFRHAHNVAFEKSDLFFICMLRPLSTHIEIDNLEIRAAKWMPLAEPRLPRRGFEVEAEAEEEDGEEDDGAEVGDQRGAVMSELAAVVRRFGEGMVRIEKRRMEMMREAERDWMEMETKRAEMVMESQRWLVDRIAGALESQKKAKKSHDNV